MRLRVDLAYDGAPFSGFARQPDQLTVQGVLEQALSRLLGQPVTTTAAGRTDRGVHAHGQVVHADVDATVPQARRWLADLRGLRGRLDRMVGDAITVWAVRRVPDGFDARASATARQYRYRIVDAPMLDPLLRHAVWHVATPLRVSAMRRGARLLLGEHDFAAFCRRPRVGTTVRRLDEVRISRPAVGIVDLRFRAPAFCHQQVRAMVGCLVAIGRGLRPPEWIGEVLASRDRAQAAPVAPPQGLLLERVFYGRRFPSSPPPDAAPRWGRHG